jgi:hypothetical protein
MKYSEKEGSRPGVLDKILRAGEGRAVRNLEKIAKDAAMSELKTLSL